MFLGLPLLLIIAGSAFAQAPKIPGVVNYTSRYYQVESNLPRKVLQAYALHMDIVYAQYAQRFHGFQMRRHERLPLFLFQTHAQYLSFMDAIGADGRNSGGMFFIRPKASGLATWVGGRPTEEVFRVLQHEGFHQFAWYAIGENLPVWVNEGLAQYFQDGIIVHGRLVSGLANAHRIALVRKAIKDGSLIPFQRVLDISGQDWGQTLHDDAQTGALLYAEAWSITYFLIHGDNGRYQKAFLNYLHLVSQGIRSSTAMQQAFGVSDLTPAETRWRKFALTQQPDTLTTAVRHMTFLGEAMQYLLEHHITMPKTVAELESALRRRRFRMTMRSSDGLTLTLSATDESLFHFQRSNKAKGNFVMMPAKGNLPPGLSAPGMSPMPVLTWSRDAQGKLVQKIEYR